MENNKTVPPHSGGVTGGTAESDSESTGSHDSTLGHVQGDEGFEIVSISPHSNGEIVNPETENVPGCSQEVKSNTASNSRDIGAIENSDSPVMIRTEFDLKLNLKSAQNSPECEQLTGDKAETETGLNTKFDQALSLAHDKAVDECENSARESTKNLQNNTEVLPEITQKDEEMEKSGKRKLLDQQNNSQEQNSCDNSGEDLSTPQKQLKTAPEPPTETGNGDSNCENITSVTSETGKNLPTKLPDELNASNRRRSFCQLDQSNPSESSSPRRKQSHQENGEESQPINQGQTSNEESTERMEPVSARNDVSVQYVKKGAGEDDDDNDESDEEELEGMKLTKVLDCKTAKKKSFKFKFTVGCDIFHLGLNENKLYCGVLISSEVKDSQSFFYAGKKTDVQTKTGIMEVEALVPESDLKNFESFSYQYAVAQSNAKNVAQDEPDLFRVSSGVQMITDLSKKEIDDTEVMQKFLITPEPDASDDDDDDDDESEEEEDLGAKLMNVLDYKLTKKKGSKVFKFTAGVDIFKLGLDESQLYCGVVVSNGAGKKSFYAGRKTDVQTKTGIVEIEALVPEVDLKGSDSISYQYAVAQSCSKNVTEGLSLIRFSYIGVQTLSDRNKKVIDDTTSKQTFCNLSDVDFEPARAKKVSEQDSTLNEDTQQSTTRTGLEVQSCKTFRFLLSNEISQLGIPESKLTCGVVIFLDNPQSTSFYPGFMVDSKVGNEANVHLFEFEVTVPENEFRGENFQYLCAVSNGPEKTIEQSNERKIIGSQIGALSLPVQGTLVIDDRKEVQFFKVRDSTEQVQLHNFQEKAVQLSIKEDALPLHDDQKAQSLSRDETAVGNEELLTDDEDSEEKNKKVSKMLMKIREPADLSRAEKQRSLEIRFCVGTGIFDLGLDNDNLFCGAVVELSGESPNFYPGLVDTIDLPRSTARMVSYVPLDDVSSYKSFQWSCAISQSPERSVLQNNSEFIKFSPLMPRREKVDSGKQFDDTSRIHFSIENKPEPAPRRMKITENASMDNLRKDVSEQNKLTAAENEQASVAELKRQASEQTSSSSRGQSVQEHPLSVNDQSSLEQHFAVVSDNSRPHAKKEPYWHFKFKVGLDIFDLGLNTENLFCGVVILPERKTEKSGTFFPGVKVKIDEETSELELEVVIPKEEIHFNKTFKYAYAVSETHMKVVMSNNPEAVALSYTSATLAANRPREVDDRSESLTFKRSVTTLKERAKQQPPKDNRKKQSEKQNEEQNIASGYEMVPEDGKEDFEEPKVDLIGSGCLLKDVLGNTERDHLHEHSADKKFVELNVVVGPDVMMLGKRRLLFGVRTSVDGFVKTTPAYIVAEFDGYFWLRMQFDSQHKYNIDYKYIVTPHRNSNPYWELMHKTGAVNRKVSRPYQQSHKVVKFDGLVSFVQPEDGNKPGMMMKVWNKLKDGIKEGTDKRNDFYLQQNSAGLDLFMSILFQKLVKKELDLNSFATLGQQILDSMSQINVGELSSYNHTLKLMSEENLVNKIFETFLKIYDDSKMNCGEQLESFECQMAIIAIFVLIDKHQTGLTSISCVADDVFDRFLTSARFLSETGKKTLSEALKDSPVAADAIEKSCALLIQAKGIQNNVHYPALIEWRSLLSSSHFLKLPASLKLKQEIVAASQVYYTSVFTRRQLLLVYLSNPWESFKLIEELNLTSDEIIGCYYRTAASSHYFTRDAKLINLLVKLITAVDNELSAFTPEISLNFLDSLVKLITLAGRNSLMKSEIDWFNDLISLALDFVEASERFGLSLIDSQNFNLKNFLVLLASNISKANLMMHNLSSGIIRGWGNILRPRKKMSPQSRELVEAKCKQSIMEVLTQKIIIKDLHVIFHGLANTFDVIKQKFPSFDETGVQTLFDEAIIRSFHDYLNRNTTSNYQFDLDSIAQWSPELEITFAQIASKHFPVINAKMHHHDVVLKMIAWKPFIALVHLAIRSPSAKRYFKEEFAIVEQSFKVMYQEIDSGNISFSLYGKLLEHKTMLQEICMRTVPIQSQAFEQSMALCASLSSEIQSSFEKFSKLKELILKFRSSNIEIDTSELDNTMSNWQNVFMSSFATVDRRGKVTMTCKTLEQADVEALQKFSMYLKSRLFTDIAFREVRRHCQDESVVCTYVDLLHLLLKTIEQKYLYKADQLVQGQMNAKEAQNLFERYRETEKVEEIDFMFHFIKLAVKNGKQIKQIESFQPFRRQQISKLDSLCKNKDFVQVLFDLKQVLQMENEFLELETLARLAS